ASSRSSSWTSGSTRSCSTTSPRSVRSTSTRSSRTSTGTRSTRACRFGSGARRLPDRLAPRNSTGLESAAVTDPAPVQHSLVGAGDLTRRRALSPVELLDAVLARIDVLNPTLNAFTTLVPLAEVRAAAREAEKEIARGDYRGPFHGIPVG